MVKGYQLLLAVGVFLIVAGLLMEPTVRTTLRISRNPLYGRSLRERTIEESDCRGLDADEYCPPGTTYEQPNESRAQAIGLGGVAAIGAVVIRVWQYDT